MPATSAGMTLEKWVSISPERAIDEPVVETTGASVASHHRDLERREHSKVTPISGVKLLGPEAAAPWASGGSWVDVGCWADGNWGGGGGGRVSVASSVHFARRLPLLRK